MLQNFHKDGTCNYCFYSKCGCLAVDTWFTSSNATLSCDCCGATDRLAEEDIKVLVENANPRKYDKKS